MTGMTDIHCHVLPGVDDGARDMDESLDMLAIMYDEGIRNVILTPHYHGGHVQPHIDTLRQKLEELKDAAEGYENLAQMNLYLGCELYYYPSAVEWLSEEKVPTLADSRYVLLEFGYSMDKRMIEDGVTRVAAAGFYPVIAHIERYRKLAGDMKAVDDLIERGALIQINSGSLYEGWHTKSFVKKLLKEEMVHFVGTDAHDIRGRIPSLARESEYITRHFGEDYCRRLLIDNPAMIIKGG